MAASRAGAAAPSRSRPLAPRGTRGADRARAALVVLTALAQVVAPSAALLLPGAQDVGTTADRYDSPLQPADYAFAVWGLVFVGCLAVAVYQALPRQLARPVHRRTGWLLVAAFTANAAWEVVYTSGRLLVLPQLLIVAIVVPLAVAHARLQPGAAPPGAGAPVGGDRWLLRPVVALFLGWVTVATLANAGSTGVYLGLLPPPSVTDLLAAAALLVAGALLIWLVSRSRAAAGPLALASCWAVLGIAASGRATVVTLAAALAAAAVSATLLVALARRRPGQRRELLLG